MMDDASLQAVLADPERLAVLKATGLLDSPAEEAFDRFTRLAASLLDTPISLITLVDDKRQFFKSSVGLPDALLESRQTPLSYSFCKHVVANHAVLQVADAASHPLVKDSPAVSELGIKAYMGFPLTSSEGQPLGSFCAIDLEPRDWSHREMRILEDLARWVVTEFELRRALHLLNQSYSELQNLELQREELVQMLVHDLRNPLASLLGGLDLLAKKSQLGEDHSRVLELALRGGESMRLMIDSILEANKAETFGLDLEITQVSVAECLENASQQVRQLAETSGVELHVEMDPELSLDADALKLDRLLVNLLSNAIQHTPMGGAVTMVARGMSDSLLLQVKDTGRGIPQDAHELIFEKYGQVKAKNVRRASMGLGLPLCKQVAEAHGGRIWVESELAEGTVFNVVLPLRPSE